MKRGDRVKDQYGNEGTVQGPEDSEGYDQNYPGDDWELVLFDVSDNSVWAPRWTLELIES